MKRALVAAAMIVAAVSCASANVEPLALSVTATATPVSVAVGDTVSFVADAQGNSIITLTADFGDGTTATMDVPLVRHVKNTFKHAYAKAGSFTLSAQVVQADAATKSATAALTVR